MGPTFLHFKTKTFLLLPLFTYKQEFVLFISVIRDLAVRIHLTGG